ncbi:hypothetical protein VU04_10225 [Desulfobulbus sp. TB]|nr:hypothetical protein [Desulfobulbus sp. TB]
MEHMQVGSRSIPGNIAWKSIPGGNDHVHLLCTPRQDGGTNRMMQSLCRRYVQYFNFASIRVMYATPGIPLFGRKPTGSAEALS